MTLIALVASFLGQARNMAGGTTCLSNLRSLSQAFAFYTVDNTGHYPDPASNNMAWEQSISNFLPPPSTTSTASVFHCPADQEIYPAVNSSYDWRDTGVPATTLAGRSVTDVTRENAILVFDVLPGWHAPKMINVSLMTGSAYSDTQSDWLGDLNTPLRGP